jgi:hypothetical protein
MLRVQCLPMVSHLSLGLLLDFYKRGAIANLLIIYALYCNCIAEPSVKLVARGPAVDL